MVDWLWLIDILTAQLMDVSLLIQGNRNFQLVLYVGYAVR